jgi:hypothetical protein
MVEILSFFMVCGGCVCGLKSGFAGRCFVEHDGRVAGHFLRASILFKIKLNYFLLHSFGGAVMRLCEITRKLHGIEPDILPAAS